MEKYNGVRFKVEFLRNEPPKDKRIRELALWCKRFHSSCLTPVIEGKSMGNLSFRLRRGVGEFIITASGLGPKDSLSPECFVKVVGCDLNRRVVYASGVREPSSESMLHCRIYELREDVNSIFHGHSREILDHAADLGLAQTERWYPYGSLDLVRSVEKVLNGNDFVVMKDHGFLSFGRKGNGLADAGSLALEKLRQIRVIRGFPRARSGAILDSTGLARSTSTPRPAPTRTSSRPTSPSLGRDREDNR